MITPFILLMTLIRPAVVCARAEPLASESSIPATPVGGQGVEVLLPQAPRDLDLPPAITQQPLDHRGSGEQARNAVFFEAGGAGLLYSVNYERLLGGPMPEERTSANFALRLGFAVVPRGAFSVPATASILLRYGNHALDLGGGCVWSSLLDIGLVGTAIVGYRYGSPAGGPVIRVAYTPLFGGAIDRSGVGNWFGIAFGALF